MTCRLQQLFNYKQKSKWFLEGTQEAYKLAIPIGLLLLLLNFFLFLFIHFFPPQKICSSKSNSNGATLRGIKNITTITTNKNKLYTRL